MDAHQKVLFVDAATGYYRITRFPVGDFFGPVDLGLHLAGRHNSLNIGVGLLAGSIFPGSNRLIFTGFSPCWGGFFVSSMGGRRPGLRQPRHQHGVPRRPGADAVACSTSTGRTARRSRSQLVPVDLPRVWGRGRGGIYALMDHAVEQFGGAYKTDPRILAVGPAAAGHRLRRHRLGARSSRGKLTHVDTWAGRGGLGSKMLQQHGIAAVIYGGTFVDEDFRDRKRRRPVVPGQVPEEAGRQGPRGHRQVPLRPEVRDRRHLRRELRHHRRARCWPSTTASIYLSEAERQRSAREVHRRPLPPAVQRGDHRRPSSSTPAASPARPCARRCGTSSRRTTSPTRPWGRSAASSTSAAAERLNHHADTLRLRRHLGGRRPLLADGVPRPRACSTPEELGVTRQPGLLARGLQPRDRLACTTPSWASSSSTPSSPSAASSTWRRAPASSPGAWRARRARQVLDPFVYMAYARKGWMVPNQYWTPGALSPMAIMGKYYMYYGAEFMPPRKLGRINAAALPRRADHGQPGHVPVPPPLGRGDAARGRSAPCTARRSRS